ncbi:MAG: protein kinase, partial [Myxococcota bacterium]|nr:protein kinase [Myxococcota bacterium]
MGWICSRCEKTFEDRSVSCVDCGAPLVVDLRGQVLAGRYRLDTVIGTGSQESSVWKAWQVSFERPVAVKIMPAGDELARERFARGARIASMLAHPHITTVHDYGETDDGRVFLVMEYLEGRVLRAETRAAEPMVVERVLHIAQQVLRALEDAHGHAVVHRDLKPDNLFLTHRAGDPDFVKVLDFGIAKYFEVSNPEDTEQTKTMEQQLTHGWQLCGTPLYMSPEQVSGEAVDGRTDLYGLGVVMYQMLTGAVPFRAKTQYAVLSQHLRDPPPTFAEVHPDSTVPASLEALVMKALAKEPSERCASAREMRHELAEVQSALGLAVERTDETVRRPGGGPPVAPSAPGQPLWVLGLFIIGAVLFGAVVTHFAMEAFRGAPSESAGVHTTALPADTPTSSAAPVVAEAPVVEAPVAEAPVEIAAADVPPEVASEPDATSEPDVGPSEAGTADTSASPPKARQAPRARTDRVQPAPRRVAPASRRRDPPKKARRAASPPP